MRARIGAALRLALDAASRERFLIGASVFRILCGATILFQYLTLYPQRHYLFGPAGVWPFEATLRQMNERGAWTLYALSPEPALFELLYHLGILITTAWLVGWRTRWLTPLVLLMLWSLHQRNPMLWDGGDNAIRLMLFFAMFANLGARFSLDAARHAARPAPPGPLAPLGALLHNAAILSFALQLSLLYAVAGLLKVQGEMWVSGTALYYILRSAEFTWPGVSHVIYTNIVLTALLTYGSMALQVAFPFLFWLNRRTRLLVLGAALSFHVGIGVIMGLVTFAAFIIATELALLTDGEYRWLRGRAAGLRQGLARRLARGRALAGAHPALAGLRLQVFYDGWCPLCARSVARLRQLDLLGLLEPISFREPGALEAHGLDGARAEARMQVRAGARQAEGIVAVLMIATRLPPLWPAVPLLAISARAGFGMRVYDWIASRRTLLPTGCADQCALGAARDERAGPLSA